MHTYEKPNVILPVSLHDSRVNRIVTAEDEITFIIEGGIRTVEGKRVEQTGRATVSFAKVDFDFCTVYCTGRDNLRKEWDIRAFASALQAGGMVLDVIDETYGYNQAKFTCNLTGEQQWFACDIEVYHFGPMHYAWED